MFIIYDLVFLLFSLVYFPVYLFRRKFHSGFLIRMGFLPRELDLDKPIWIHAVSVGEVIAIKGLLQELKKIYPHKKFIISTVTATGNKIARTFCDTADFITYLPLDFSFIVRRVINRINPSMFILAETEIWPNLISVLYSKNIPVFIVNGRISDKSFSGYLAARFFIKPVLKKINIFCAQTEADKDKIISLGLDASKVKVTGNMKFDIKMDISKDYTLYRNKLGLTQADKLFVCGSTHAKEDEIIIAVYKELLREFPNLKLLIAPRHPERAGDVEKTLSSFGFRSIFISSLSLECPTCLTKPVFILDTVGELVSFYAISDIVFVGGSLIEKGGHNIIEPAALAKPVLFGPYMSNFSDVKDLFLNNNAAIQVKDAQDLMDKAGILLRDANRSKILSEHALEVVQENHGATAKTLELIK